MYIHQSFELESMSKAGRVGVTFVICAASPFLSILRCWCCCWFWRRHVATWISCRAWRERHLSKWRANDTIVYGADGAQHHPRHTHYPRSGSQDHHPSTNSVQKTIRCNSTSNAPDDGRTYAPETWRAKNISIKLPRCIKLAFHIILSGRYTVKQHSSIKNTLISNLNLILLTWRIWRAPNNAKKMADGI